MEIPLRRTVQGVFLRQYQMPSVRPSDLDSSSDDDDDDDGEVVVVVMVMMLMMMMII